MNIYILAFLLLFTVFSSSLLPDRRPDPKTEKAGTAKEHSGVFVDPRQTQSIFVAPTLKGYEK